VSAGEDRVRSATEADETRKRLEEERGLLAEAKQSLSDAFAKLAGDALRQNAAELREQNANDLDQRKLAIESLVKPVGESLVKMDQESRSLEQSRADAYGGLRTQLAALASSHSELKSETSNLVAALRAPKVRGTWGEVQLRRVLELAGMLERCDFYAQPTLETSEGRLRPDVRVQLPGGMSVVIDAKVPLDAYLEALAAETAERRALKLREHSRQVRARVNDLSSKKYAEHVTPAAEFVI